MNWIVLILAVLTVATLVALPIACLARVVSWIPGAGKRRWIVIGFALVLFCAASFLAINAVYFPNTYRDPARFVVTVYAHLPTTTLLFASLLVVALVCLFGFLVYGFLPQSGVDYRPRAAQWRILRLLKRMSCLLSFLIFALVLQDFELRWRLNKLEAVADAIAREMAPAPIPDDQNAAKFYQQAILQMRNDSSLENRDEYNEAAAQFINYDTMNDKVREYFRRRESVRELASKAANCERCRYDDSFAVLDSVDGSDTNDIVSAIMYQWRELAKLAATEQRSAEAIECLHAIRRRENHLIEDPRNTNTRIFFHAGVLALEVVQDIIARCRSLPKEELSAMIAKPLPVDAIHRQVIKWHAAIASKQLAVLYDGRFYQREYYADGGRFGPPPMHTILPSWLVFPTMRFLCARDDITSIINRYRCIREPSDDEAWVDACRDEVFPAGYFSDRLFFMEALPRYLLDGEALRRLSNIGIAAGLYHQARGEWPTKLEDLVPDYLAAVPLDPHNDLPFNVKSIDGGLMVYSFDAARWMNEFEDTDDWWRQGSEQITPVLFLGTAYTALNESRR